MKIFTFLHFYIFTSLLLIATFGFSQDLATLELYTNDNSDLTISIPNDDLSLNLQANGECNYWFGDPAPIIQSEVLISSHLKLISDPNFIIDLEDILVYFSHSGLGVFEYDISYPNGNSIDIACLPSGQYIWEIKLIESINSNPYVKPSLILESPIDGEVNSCGQFGSDLTQCYFFPYRILNITNDYPLGSLPDISLLTTNPSCSPVNNGMIESVVTNGTQPYYYSWSNGIEGPSNVPFPFHQISSLPEGDYSLTVTDANNCIAFAETSITNDLNLDIDLSIEKPCTDTYLGNVLLTHLNGVAPYTYNWSNGETTQNLSGTQVGNYSVTVTDLNGCQVSESITLTSEFTASDFDYPNGKIITSPSTTLLDLNNDGVISVNGTIVIKAGVNFTISNKIFEFNDYLLFTSPDQGITKSGVLVEPGAKLTATNCTFKGITTCSDKMWQGIQVWGDDFVRLQPTKPVKERLLIQNENSLNNGELILTNCLIQDALIGVAAYRVNQPFSPNLKDHGRGKLTAKFTTFKNNNVGVAFSGRSLISNNSSIKECDFICDASLIDADLFGGNGINSFIRLSSVKNPIIEGNTFKGNTSFSIENRGSGIVSYSAAYKVQSGNASPTNPSTPPLPNRFDDLSKGIDVYSLGGAVSTVKIKNNYFNNVYQGITANGSNFDEISYNTFNTPMGDVAFNSWGMFMQTSSGFLATENTFNSLATNQYTFGFVNRNVNSIMGEVYKNNFNGDFQAATQAEGTSNTKLLIDCNRYTGENTYDWTMLSGSLVDQGVCLVDITEAVVNVFGECVVADESQIYSTANFNYSTISGFEPNCLNTSFVTLLTCDFGTFQDMCPQIVTDPCPSCIVALGQQVDFTPPGLQRDKFKGELIRSLAQNGDIQELVTFLTSEALPEDMKIVIPTHIQRKEFTEARTLLNAVDQNDDENQKFVQLFDVLTTIGETERELDQMTDSEKLIIEMIANSGAQVSIQAQALLAELSNTQYTRFPEMIPSSSAMIISSNEEELNPLRNESLNSFEIFPNPSQGDVTIQSNSENNFSINIYDYSGRNVFTSNSNDGKIKVSGLSTGVYTVEINNFEGSKEIKKLFVH